MNLNANWQRILTLIIGATLAAILSGCSSPGGFPSLNGDTPTTTAAPAPDPGKLTTVEYDDDATGVKVTPGGNCAAKKGTITLGLEGFTAGAQALATVYVNDPDGKPIAIDQKYNPRKTFNDKGQLPLSWSCETLSVGSTIVFDIAQLGGPDDGDMEGQKVRMRHYEFKIPANA
jgi:hypothetical protein